MRVLEKNKIKVIETEKLLKEIITSPQEFLENNKLIQALKSQSAIAKYQDNERNISPCSLNTVKSLAEVMLDRGFYSLNELRINAKLAIESAQSSKNNSKPNKQTVIGLKQKVKELESQLEVMRQSNLFMTITIQELRSRLKQLSEHEGTLEERKELYQYHNKKVEAQLSYSLHGEFSGSM